jgi:hypothetical protein
MMGRKLTGRTFDGLVALEKLVDEHGLDRVLGFLSDICGSKSSESFNHDTGNGVALGNQWAAAGGLLNRLKTAKEIKAVSP